ncbi:hypothetical protein AAG570_008987 [Ranatra chinensis]|uniref:Uncharacterized protein n=1 Tax=Ranatra chinensis TaxID=642074 RepID=A0ABD0YST5_9HEMI
MRIATGVTYIYNRTSLLDLASLFSSKGNSEGRWGSGRSRRCAPVRMLAAEPRTAGPQEGLDHLFLLPECVLSMDSGQLRRDLAGLDFRLHLLTHGPSGNVWLCKATNLLLVIFYNELSSQY